jgi:hypothetical protein
MAHFLLLIFLISTTISGHCPLKYISMPQDIQYDVSICYIKVNFFLVIFFFRVWSFLDKKKPLKCFLPYCAINRIYNSDANPNSEFFFSWIIEQYGTITSIHKIKILFRTTFGCMVFKSVPVFNRGSATWYKTHVSSTVLTTLLSDPILLW